MRSEEARVAYEALIKYYPFTLDDLPGEQWLPIPDWQDYHVSNYGRVKSLYGRWGKPKIIRPTLSTKGYLQLLLSKGGKGKTFRVHRLVALTFIPNPLGKPEVNHIDGHKLNNFVDNLEWVTGSENMSHAYNTGLQPSGQDRHDTTLTNQQVQLIRANPDGLNTREIAKIFGVDPRRICNIQLGRSWKHAGGVVRQSKYPKLSNEIKEQIRAEYVYGSREFGSNALAKKYGVNRQTILNILKERT